MKSLTKFYNTLFGRVLIDAFIGFLVGYLIFLWRGNERAPFICASAVAVMGYLKLKRIWPWNTSAEEK